MKEATGKLQEMDRLGTIVSWFGLTSHNISLIKVYGGIKIKYWHHILFSAFWVQNDQKDCWKKNSDVKFTNCLHAACTHDNLLTPCWFV